MFEVQGKYGTAKIFTDVVEQSAIAQVIGLLNQPYVEGSQVRMMPDIHAGAGCTIGTTMTIKDKVCPNLVGVDIGCGMETARLREDHIDLQKLDQVIRSKIPSGFDIQEKAHPFARKVDLSKLCCANKLNLDHAYNCLGTLGGGNHFIEANRDDDGNIYIVIHSGSRHLGMKVAMYYQKAGYKALTTYSREEIQAVVDEMKAAGRSKEIEKRLLAMGTKPCPVPEDYAYVEGDLFEQYIHDMEIVQKFASLNRQAMMNDIITAMGLHVEEQFSTIHNYIDTGNRILRKGAVSAQAGEKLLIPINMRDGSLLCTGKGNPDWNFSGPHGAGRLMSRSAAKAAFTVDEFRKEMAGIYTTSVGRSTLDECPMAYKGMSDIVDNIGPTVTDVGFRVFKLDDTNMTDVYYSAGEYSQDMLSLLESNIKPDRTDLDLLLGCLLEWGLPLSMPYTAEQIEGCTVHTYNDGDLIACFDENIPDTVIKEIAKRQPLRTVFRDNSFANSPAKINVGEIFKMLAPDTRVKVL